MSIAFTYHVSGPDGQATVTQSRAEARRLVEAIIARGGRARLRAEVARPQPVEAKAPAPALTGRAVVR